jgi:hypothetical protein
MKLTADAKSAALLYCAETKEDKDLLRSMMMDHMQPTASVGAYITLELRPNGEWKLSSELNGRMHSSYARMPQDRLLATELPKLFAELSGDAAKLAASQSEVTL